MDKVLILEDDQTLAASLNKVFFTLGCNTDITNSINQAALLVEKVNYQLAIIDRVLPDGDGLEIVELLNLCQFNTKILILSTQNQTAHKIEGLKNGADDYLAKPFSMKELTLRITKLLATRKITLPDCIACDQLVLYPETGSLMIDGGLIQIRKKEAKILECLLKHQGLIISHQTIINHVWDDSSTPSSKTIGVYIRRLRMRLKKFAPRIQTIRGMGYRFS